MDIVSLFFISVGLAMDTFAVSLTEGVALKQLKIKPIFKVALIFGIFQGMMPLIGWKIGNLFYEKIKNISSVVVFLILLFVGIKMILEARSFSSCETNKDCGKTSNILLLGIATSIDALTIGFSFSLLPNINIYYSITIIGIVTFVLSGVGVCIGNKVGQLLGAKAEYLGGIILIFIGIKSLF